MFTLRSRQALCLCLAASALLLLACTCSLFAAPSNTDPSRAIYLDVGGESQLVTVRWEGVWIEDDSYPEMASNPEDAPSLEDAMQIVVAEPGIVSVVETEARRRAGPLIGGLATFDFYVTLKGEAAGVTQITLRVKPQYARQGAVSSHNPPRYYTVAVGQSPQATVFPLATPQ